MSSERSASKSSIEKLVRFFEQNIYQLKSSNFNETQARQQLIDPFFEALGWDVRNRKMNPIYLQEVIPEGRVKTSVGKEAKEQQALFETKATLGKRAREYASILDYIAEDNYKASWKEAIKKPDYRFRIRGQTKFFVEAKKPFVDLSKSAEAIFQVKRYGFSGRVPVSILTDFEEFRTFDCTHKPEFDKPKLGIVKEFDLTYKQYLDEFERLYDTFSRDAVEGGSLDTLTRKLLLKKTGDFALDKHFLEDLSKWREDLARDIAKHPKNRRRLTDYTLNESVQRILDRIVFFRVCEDREIEVENTLLAILRLWQGRPGVSLYSLLNDLFKQRRPLYNGLLFAPHECEELEVGDDVLLKILEGLNYPFSPYYFNEIGVEILGSIYEKFLGKTIHLTPKTVRVEEKPEVRKAGGVYYTPQYIVNYIVDNTVGKLLHEDTDGNAGKRKLKLSPKQVARLKIIDIACGSGSFLLGAFQKLIDYHTEWYHEHPKDVESVHNVPDAYTDVNGSLRLSSRKKRDILLNNIYGVDIDRQAVEVTQMSLYLKVLEGENAETLNPQMMLALKEAYLPSLGDNIKCGNSLIGTDISAQADLFDSEATQRINPFDWETEFPEIFKSPLLTGERKGGFDVVIGNPPWITMRGKERMGVSDEVVDYYLDHYKDSAEYKVNSFALFVERAVRCLKTTGRMGYIIPTTLLSNQYLSKIRNFLLVNTTVVEIVDLGNRVFEEGVADCMILVLMKGMVKENKIRILGDVEDLQRGKFSEKSVPQHDFEAEEGCVFSTNISMVERNLASKMKANAIYLGRLMKVYVGIVTGDNKKFISNKKEGTRHKKILVGEDLNRYSLRFNKHYVLFDKAKLWSNTDESVYLKPEKLLLRKTGSQLIVALDTDKFYTEQTIYNLYSKDSIDYKLKYILAVLNSKLIQFYFSKKLITNPNAYPYIKGIHIEIIPIRTIDFKNPEENKMHDELVSLADKMLDLHKKLHKATFDSEKEPIERQIAATDKKIDKLVYELYGLTEEEIKIVEGAH